MKITKRRQLDDAVYILACFFSLGAVWLLRVIITQAIKSAIEA